MARKLNYAPGELTPAKPKRKTPQRRKGPDEWRAINRSFRVKDGRSLILAVPDPRRPGEHIVGEAYWHVETAAWWWANTAPGVPGCDAIEDVYGAPEAWMPMPSAPALFALQDAA